MPLTAFLSVADKTLLMPTAANLAKLDCRLYAYGNTERDLLAASLQIYDPLSLLPYTQINHRPVASLDHRELHAKLLAWLAEEDSDVLRSYGLTSIDLVWVDLVKLPDPAEVKPGDSIPKLDTGGTTMMSAAARGRRIIIPTLNWRSHVLDWLRDGQPNREAELSRMATQTERHVAAYLSHHATCVELARTA